MSSEEQSKVSYKVNDRRRFDADGNEKDNPAAQPVVAPSLSPPSPATTKNGSVITAAQEMPAETPTSAKADLSVEAPNFSHKPSTVEPEPADGINFTSFVMSLATQALMQLGEVPPPPGVALTVDKEGAQQTIDILQMLARKSKGNLTPEESQLMDEVLHSLRVEFVRKR